MVRSLHLRAPMRPLLILSALLAFGQLHAQKAFPRIEGQTAEGRTVVLPEAAPRKYTMSCPDRG